MSETVHADPVRDDQAARSLSNSVVWAQPERTAALLATSPEGKHSTINLQQFADNSPRVNQLRKIQQLVDDSPRVNQLGKIHQLAQGGRSAPVVQLADKDLKMKGFGEAERLSGSRGELLNKIVPAIAIALHNNDPAPLRKLKDQLDISTEHRANANGGKLDYAHKERLSEETSLYDQLTGIIQFLDKVAAEKSSGSFVEKKDNFLDFPDFNAASAAVPETRADRRNRNK